MQKATPILLGGFVLPFFRRPLEASLWPSTVALADRVALKVQYPRTPKRPGVPRERERTFISAGDAVSNLV